MASNIKGLKAEISMDNRFDMFPDFLDGKLCWTSRDFEDGKDKYIVKLTTDEVHAVQSAIVHFKGSDNPCPLVSRLISRLSKHSAKVSHI